MPLAPNDIVDAQLSGDVVVYPGSNIATLQNTPNVQSVIESITSSTPHLGVVTATAATTAIGSASVAVTGASLPLTPGGSLVTGGIQVDNSQATARAFTTWLGMASGSVSAQYGSLAEEIDNISPVTEFGFDLSGYVVVATAGTLQCYVGSNGTGASVVTSASIGASGIPVSGFVAVQVH